MRTAYINLSLALSSLAAAAGAQEHVVTPRGVPVERFPGDPVQGGAMKEYRTPIEQAPPGHRYRIISPYPMATDPSSGDAGIDTSTMPPPLPGTELAVQSRNGLSWLCGGIGVREVAYMKSEARRYDLMLTFATRNGAYLADVNVTIIGEAGLQLLNTQCGGPIMLVEVPRPGTYRIRAEAEGYEVARTVTIEASKRRHRHLAMTWPASAADKQRGITSSGESDSVIDEEGGENGR